MIKNTYATNRFSSDFINKINEANRPASDGFQLNQFELWSSHGAPLVNQPLTEFGDLVPHGKSTIQNTLTDISDKKENGDVVDLDTAVSSLAYLKKAVENAEAREFQLSSPQDARLDNIQKSVDIIRQSVSGE